MHLESIGPIIAERTYHREDGVEVVVRIGKPAPFPGDGNYFCPFEIEGLFDETTVSRAGGVDAVQALLLALQMIRVMLRTSGKEIFWFDEGDPDLGLSLPDPD